MFQLATNYLTFIINIMNKLRITKNTLLLILLCLNIGILFMYAYIHIVNMDEREHLYASYMVHNGYLPYRDFFEHHHPLLWYIFAPFLYFCDNTPYIWYVIRTFGMAVILGCAYYVYKLMHLISDNKQSALIAVLIYLSFDIVHISGTEFRPDNLMILFLLAGLYNYLRYKKELKWPLLACSYTLFFLSFFTLQKSLFMLIALALIITYDAFKNNHTRHQIFLTLAIPLGLTLIYLIYLYYTDTLKDYFELNWLIYLHHSVNYNLIKWHSYIIPLIGVLCTLIPNKSKLPYLSTIKFLYLAEIITLSLSATSPQYLLPLYPFLAIILAVTISTIKKEYGYIGIFIIFILTTGFSFYNIYKYPQVPLQGAVHLSKIIISNSKKNDLIIPDMLWSGGLRKSAYGYYWFGLEGDARLDYKIFHRHTFPNINLIIQSRKPKIIANTDIRNCLDTNNRITLHCPIEQTIEPHSIGNSYLKSEFIYLRTD